MSACPCRSLSPGRERVGVRGDSGSSEAQAPYSHTGCYRDAAPASPVALARLVLRFALDEHAVTRRAALEGTYVLQTSLAADNCSPEQVDAYRRSLTRTRTA